MDIIFDNGIALFGFMAPLQISQLLFAWRAKHREHFVSRFLFAELLYVLCGIGIIAAIYYGKLSGTNILMYFIVFACSVAVIELCYDIPHIEVVFITTCGYALQHMGYSIYEILQYYLVKTDIGAAAETLFNVGVQLVVSLAAYFLVIRRNAFAGERRERDPRMVALAVLILFFSVCLSVWTSVESQDGSEAAQILGTVICKLYAIISCALVISMEYAVSRMNMISKQNEFMEQLIHTQGSQLQMSKESISIINRKCHDIKYQMKALGMMNNTDKRQEYVDDLRKAISIYDSVYHTGNEALNLLLQEKTLLCDEYQIQFSCMADGDILSFISPDDLYVLLGNALDNAIESVMKEQDIDKRVISMNIGFRQGMKSIHVENYCKEKVEFQNGLPVTSKKDKNHHGFGVQSIQYITEKYHGNVVMQNRKDTFYLDIFFPTES